MPPGTASGLIQPLLGIAVLALVLKIPGLMRGGGGGGGIVGGLVGSAAGAVVGSGASRLAWGGLGSGSRLVARGPSSHSSTSSQLTLPMTVGVPAGHGADQLTLPVSVPQPARGEA
jgi:hypothetical protein